MILVAVLAGVLAVWLIRVVVFALTHPIQFGRYIAFRSLQTAGLVGLGLGGVAWFGTTSPDRGVAAVILAAIGVASLAAANRLDRR